MMLQVMLMSKVAVVYESGKSRVLTLTEGNNRYNRICQKRKEVTCEVAPTVSKAQKSKTVKVDYIDVKMNQLVAGVYVIGELIPEGNYDQKWVWGRGSVGKYVDQTVTYDKRTMFQ